MKTALSGLMVALLVTAVPALAQTSTRHSGGRQAVSTQTQTQAGTRYSGGRQAASAQTQTGTRYSGGRHMASTQTGSTQAQTGTRDSGANFRDRQRQGTQPGWRSGEQSHVQGQARDGQRERHDGARRWAGQHDQYRQGNGHNQHWSNNDHSRHGQGQHRGWENNRGHHYGWDNNRGRHYGWDNNRGHHYGWGNDRGHRYGSRVRGWDPSVDRRQDRQQDRIAQGIRSGELTRHEAQRLMDEQRMIRQEERRYKADGVITPWERRDLQRDQDAAGRHIYQETHDAQTRF